MLKKTARYMWRHKLGTILVGILLACVIMGPRPVAASLHRGLVHVGHVALPVLGDLLWGVWTFACVLVGAG